MEDQETQETDVTPSDSSSESDSPESSAQDQEAQPQGQEAAAKPGNDANIPFHEHPRFKELIEQKNSYQEKLTGFEKQVKELSEQLARQAPPPAKPQNPYASVLERLQQVDPEFAKMQQQVLEAIEALPKFQQQYQTDQMTQIRTQYENTLSSLFKANNVDPEDQIDYKLRLQAYITQNPNTTLQEVEGLFKREHDAMGKRRESFERKIRESYVKAKKGDSTPATTTGGAPVPRKVTGPKLDTFEDRVAFAAKELRAAKRPV